jgi:hypothetical protein
MQLALEALGAITIITTAGSVAITQVMTAGDTFDPPAHPN